MPLILIVERDAALRADLARAVRAAGYRVETAPPGASLGRRLDAHRFDAVVIEVEDPADLEWVGQAAGAACRPAVIAIGGAASPGISVAAMKCGAADFLRKPFRVGSLERALSRALVAVAGALEPTPGAPEARDPAFVQLLRDARAAAASEVTIHLVGECGSGKKWLARAIHRFSPRAARPFVAVDLGGLSTQVALFELFGGAAGGVGEPAEVRPGQVACAHGGTLLLGEVGDAPPELQSRLLRLLHERTLHASGVAPARSVDIRVITTTQRDLRCEVDRGRFREDLFYRLDVVVLRVPPLRERASDIPVLARAFLERFANQAGCDPPELEEADLRALAALPLRGNVHELQNLMRRAVVLFPGARVSLDRLLAGPPRPRSAPPVASQDAPLNLRELERRAILRSLREHGGNRTHASRALGINVRTLRNKIRAYGV